MINDKTRFKEQLLLYSDWGILAISDLGLD